MDFMESEEKERDSDGDEMMPELEVFIEPDTPRPLPVVSVSKNVRANFIYMPDGRRGDAITPADMDREMHHDEFAGELVGSTNCAIHKKRKDVEKDMYANKSLAQARDSHSVVLSRKDGSFVQPASEKIDHLITAKNQPSGMSEEANQEALEKLRQKILNQVGIRDAADQELRFPDATNSEDQQKLLKQQRVITWVPSESMTSESCYKFRDNIQRGLQPGVKRVPIVKDHFDAQMKLWSGDLLNFVVTLPLISIPIVTPPFLGWLVDKHFAAVSDSFEVFRWYLCALRILIGGMDVGKNVIECQPDKLFISHDREANINKVSLFGLPLWKLANEGKRRKQVQRLRKLGYPGWFDLGIGKNPAVKRPSTFSDDDLEKNMVQYAIETKMKMNDNVLLQLNEDLSAEITKMELLLSTKATRVLTREAGASFMGRLYEICKNATYAFLDVYELTLLWVIQRHIPSQAYMNFVAPWRDIPSGEIPLDFAKYLLKGRQIVFEARTFLGCEMPPPRPSVSSEEGGSEKQADSEMLLRPADPTSPTIKEMQIFYGFLQFQTTGKDDLIDKLVRLNLATNGPSDPPPPGGEESSM